MDEVVYRVGDNNRNGSVILVSRKIEYTFPMGYAYLAGYLRQQGEPVEVLFRPNTDRQKFVDEIVRKGPLIVAFGGLFPEMEEIKEWISLFPKDRAFPIVIGGQMVSPTPELAMKNIKADFGVIGEGEIVLYQLVTALRNGTDISKIGGLIIRDDNGKLIKTGEGQIIDDLSQIPAIPFDLFPSEDWLPIGKWYASHLLSFPDMSIHWRYTDRVIPVHGGRGCPFFCNFCYHHSRPRYRPIPDMVTEAKENLRKYTGNFLYFGDDLVLASPGRARQLIDELKKQEVSVPYSVSIRFDLLKRIDDSLLKELKESGCVIMGPGVESGSDRILKIIGKNITSREILTQLKRLKDVGILVTASIMVGQYTETKEDVEASIRLMQEAVRQDPNINFAFTICTPFPGSPLYDLLFKQQLMHSEQEYYDVYFSGKRRKGDWGQIVNMSGMVDDEVFQMFTKISKVYRQEKVKALGAKNIALDILYLMSGIIHAPDSFMQYLDTLRVTTRGLK